MFSLIQRLKEKRFVSWLATAFAVPSAFSLLAKFDDRLNFTPFLERIVLNFDKFSEGVWQLFSIILAYDFTTIHSLMTVFVLFYLIMLKETLDRAIELDLNENFVLTEILSQAIVLGLAFSNFGREIIVFFIIVPIFFGMEYYFNYKRRFSREFDRYNFAIVLFYPFIAFLLFRLLEYLFKYDVGNMKLGLILGVMSTMYNQITRYRKMYFARILVFCIGIYLIDFLANTLKPNLEYFLTEIGV